MGVINQRERHDRDLNLRLTVRLVSFHIEIGTEIIIECHFTAAYIAEGIFSGILTLT